MQEKRNLGWTFDTVAGQYDKMRPGYPDELFREVLQYASAGEGTRAVEVGAGSGQATAPFLCAGCRVEAVDPGEKFAAVLREKFGAYAGFSVRTGKFEEMDFAPDSVDLVFSATAFHWVPEETGYRKVFDMLKSGGAFARFANHPFPDMGRPALFEEIQEAYRAYYYTYYTDKKPFSPGPDRTEEQAEAIAQTAAKYGFSDIRHTVFRRTRDFSAEEYAALLGTYSDHIALPEDIRRKFLAKIMEAIDHHGGTITLYDSIDLELARKP